MSLGEKSLAAPGNQTCLSGVPVQRSTDWATSPPPFPSPQRTDQYPQKVRKSKWGQMLSGSAAKYQFTVPLTELLSHNPPQSPAKAILTLSQQLLTSRYGSCVQHSKLHQLHSNLFPGGNSYGFFHKGRSVFHTFSTSIIKIKTSHVLPVRTAYKHQPLRLRSQCVTSCNTGHRQ